MTTWLYAMAGSVKVTRLCRVLMCMHSDCINSGEVNCLKLHPSANTMLKDIIIMIRISELSGDDYVTVIHSIENFEHHVCVHVYMYAASQLSLLKN